MLQTCIQDCSRTLLVLQNVWLALNEAVKPSVWCPVRLPSSTLRFSVPVHTSASSYLLIVILLLNSTTDLPMQTLTATLGILPAKKLKMGPKGQVLYRRALIGSSLSFVTFRWDAGVLGDVLLSDEFRSAMGVSRCMSTVLRR
jgi:hypothetical protein